MFFAATEDHYESLRKNNFFITLCTFYEEQVSPEASLERVKKDTVVRRSNGKSLNSWRDVEMTYAVARNIHLFPISLQIIPYLAILPSLDSAFSRNTNKEKLLRIKDCVRY